MSEKTDFQPTLNEIVVPKGEFRAPNDHEIVTGRYTIFGKPKSVDLIQQTYSGNCAEYTVIDTIVVLNKEGFAVNPEILSYVDSGRQLNMDLVESELIIPLLLNGQEAYRGIKSSLDDVDNLVGKFNDPYTALTTSNSALLFRMAVSPETADFKNGDLATAYSPDLEDSIKQNETLAIFVGSSSHATAYLKLGPNYLHIDPYFNEGVIRTETEAQALQRIQSVLRQQGSFVTLNKLRTK